MNRSEVTPQCDRLRAAPSWLRQHVRGRGATEFREIQTSTARAVIVDDNRPGRGGGVWCNNEVHYFDLCLSTRSRPSQGQFVDGAGPRNLGRMFLIPAGSSCRVEAGAGHGSSLSLFLTRHPLLDDEIGRIDWANLRLDGCLNIQNDRVREAAQHIAEEVRGPSFASALLVEGLALSLYAEVARILANAQEASVRKGGLAPWRLRLIQQRVQDDLAPPTLDELAALCGIGPRHLMRAFRQETGLTIGRFVQNAAIDRAKQLLSCSDAPISLVARRAGFASPAGFSTAFRKATGVTPRWYRATCAGRSADHS